MKKITFIALATAALLTACTGNPQQDAQTALENPDSIATILTRQLSASDPAAIASSLQQIAAHVDSLQAQGKTEEAKQYARTFQQWVADNKEAIKAKVGSSPIVDAVLEQVRAVNTDEVVDQAAEAIRNIPDTVKSQIRQAAGQAVEQAKENVREHVQERVDAHNQRVDQAKEKAAAARQQARDNADAAVRQSAEKVNEAVSNAAAAARERIHNAVTH